MDDVIEPRLLRVLHAGRGGKREFDPASKARLLEACLTPGVSISKLALENGINANLLRTWIRKHRKLKAPVLAGPAPPAECRCLFRSQRHGLSALPMAIANREVWAIHRRNGGNDRLLPPAMARYPG
ncbi:transposase [Agrobacterium salinitolerans]|nr:transposase [Agrobacterium salinitolerans]